MNIRVSLPTGLQSLAGCGPEQEIEVEAPVTPLAVVRALESRYPQLAGAIIDQHTGQRRPMLRFFGEKQDLSFEPLDKPLPDTISSGQEAFLIVGAIAGG